MSRHRTSSRFQYSTAVTSPGARSPGNATWYQPNGIGNGKRRDAMPAILEHVPIFAPVERGLASRPMERELGGVGTKVVFEDHRVRVWVLELAPGRAQRGPPARPRPPADPGEGRPDRGRPRARHRRARTATSSRPPSIPGMVTHVPKGGIETAVNTGAEPFYEIIVELKTPTVDALRPA